MTHEIEIFFFLFSRPLKSLSLIFMAHAIYNTPTFHGSWTLVPDISWQFHEPYPLSTFHRKFMAWKIGHELMKYLYSGPWKMLSWVFNDIFMELQFIVSSLCTWILALQRRTNHSEWNSGVSRNKNHHSSLDEKRDDSQSPSLRFGNPVNNQLC